MQHFLKNIVSVSHPILLYFWGEGSRSVEQILRIASKYRKVDNFDSSQAFAQLRVLSVTVTTNGKEPYKVYPGE